MSSVPSFAGMSGKNLMWFITICATMVFLLFGYDHQRVMSSIIDSDPFNNVFTATKGNSTMQGVVTAIYELGCLAGALFILACGDWLGRRWFIMLGATVVILGVILQVTAYPGHVPLAQNCIGRVITGIGNGMNTSIIPTYQAECSRTSNRGLLICVEGGTVAIGTLISYWVDFVPRTEPLISPGGFRLLSNSPRWLFARERYEEGERVIAALMGREIADHDVQLQKTLILDSLRAFVFLFPVSLTLVANGRSSGQAGKSTPMSAVLTSGKTQHCRRMLLGASSQFFQQIGGCNFKW
ncbi:hypothetical protein Asppvi_001761 [Aspergillus pseudoviridinutans]|uniref:Major facilitator superfamily (MFS) profile domain-containing protein n=1 Tax=Aspergillus pseudoviridinutans TaxID=1517512 RepID=A0A9P3EXX2_9EURO|nr:uncharacterized protein Asppvi_001761 [Aspergillus pseudoviridinutans]GIJ92484.1 hypothetical protein Asppvi_001761 [Aspergillus pseudoviridinutans]